MENATCSAHDNENLRLFCQECNDPICIKCLLSNHQQHKVQDLAEAVEYITTRLKEWCVDGKEDTVQKLQSKKLVLDESREKNDREESMNVKALENMASIWKAKIDVSCSSLSDNVKKFFEDRRLNVRGLLLDIESTLERVQNYDVEEQLLPLYISLKKVQDSSSYLPDEDKSTNGNLVVKLHPPTDHFSIGSLTLNGNETVQENYAVEKKSVGTQVSDRSFIKESNADVQKGLISQIDISEIGEFSKILPLSETDALLISGRKLFRMDITGISPASHTDIIDDILAIRGEFLVLNKDKSFVFHLSKDNVVSPFTSTDPYMPVCMGYDKSDNSVLVWMTNKDSKVMTIFDSFGVKKRSFSLATIKSVDSFMSVFTTNNFVLVYDVEQSTGRRNHVYAYTMEPKTSYSFSGKFGQSPYLQFVCKGLCYDDSGKVLCCDTQFNAVYRLDSKLEYETVLLDKHSGLKSPSAIAFQEGILWIADAKFLRKFKYEEI